MFLPFARTGDDWRERLAITWSGMRGAVSLAAALSVPATVAGQPDIVFVTVVVILVTLVGQGLTLPALLRFLRLQGDRPWSPDEAIARLETAQSALDRLDELEDEGGVSEEQLRRMRELYRARFRACQAVLGGGEQEGAADVRETRRRYSRPAPRADRRRARGAARAAQRRPAAARRPAPDPARPRPRGGAAHVNSVSTPATTNAAAQTPSRFIHALRSTATPTCS